MEEKQKDYELESRLREAAEEEQRLREHRKERKKDRKRKLQEDEEEVLGSIQSNPDIAEIMGFSGFGGSKK